MVAPRAVAGNKEDNSDLKTGTLVAMLSDVWFKGSELGPFGPVPDCWDHTRLLVWSVIAISVWQHKQLSEQIHPWWTHSMLQGNYATNQRTSEPKQTDLSWIGHPLLVWCHSLVFLFSRWKGHWVDKRNAQTLQLLVFGKNGETMIMRKITWIYMSWYSVKSTA